MLMKRNGELKQNHRKQSTNGLRMLVFLMQLVVLPAVCFYLMESYSHNPFAEVRPWAQLFNIVLFVLAALILFCLTGRFRTACRILYTAAMLYGLINAYVVRFRTNPIVPWDILSWRTAVSVADNYDFMPDGRMIAVTAAFIVAFAALHVVKIEIKHLSFSKRLIPAAAAVGAVVLFSGVLQQEAFQNRYRLYNKLFTPVYMTDVDGLAVTFVMNLAYVSIDKPQQYSRQEAQELLTSYEEKENTVDEELPNIIVVMNEAFSDLSVLGDFYASEDPLPYLHALQQGAPNTVTGKMDVSVCGGNTANTEFEFLTGNTMAFLPQGSVPYQQYITGEMDALPGYLKSLGYQTIAAHPYQASGWDRDTVYPQLGFSECIFKDGYRMPEYVRQYVSDQSCVDKILEYYEKKTPGQPMFFFTVTMQNHGGYQDRYDNFTPDIATTDTKHPSLDQYLSLLKLSDASLERLITYFSGEEEKTAVVFFGDHQPNDTVAAPVLAQNGMSWNHLDERQRTLRYQVPYVIWANYDIAEESGADTSANYLAAEALQRLGVPCSPYQSYLLDLKKEYPSVSALRLVRADGSEEFSPEKEDGLSAYWKLQYYQLFDAQ